MDGPSYIGIRSAAVDNRPFGIPQADRRAHMLVLGKTRTGKTTLLDNLAVQDIEAGRGLCFIDPHGDEAWRLLDYIPPHRADDLVYLDPAGELEHPVGFNVLAKVPRDDRPLVASHVVSIFRGLWREAWGARTEHILYNTVAALLDVPKGATLVEVPRMLTDEPYRRRVVGTITDPKVRAFWAQEFAGWDKRFQAEAV